MRTDEERREERHREQADAAYDLWRSGHNPDDAYSDHAYDRIAEGWRGEEVAREIIHEDNRRAADLRYEQEYQEELEHQAQD